MGALSTQPPSLPPPPSQQQQQQQPSSQAHAQPGPAQPITTAQKLASVNEQTWLSMGKLAEMMTDYDKAMSCFDAALKHNPYSVAALSKIASLYRGREQFDQAVDYFKRILAIQENNGETWAALGHCYLMMDNLQEAYHAYQQALYHLSNPKDPKLWYGIGILYDRYGSLEHAEEAFSAVMKMDPSFEKANEIYFRLGIIYKQQQKFDLSLQCFRYILHSPPKPLTESDIWFQTGHVYEQQKEYEQAKEAYERVLADNPDHAKVLQQLGWLYHQQNTSFCSQTHAIQYLTRSLKSDSTDAQSWYLLGRCYMAEQNYNKAYEAYQQAVYRDARNPTFWCSIGVLYYQINQYRDALDAYSRAIRLNPYISEVWYDLGTLYESCNNQVQDALDAYQRAAELDPTNPHIKQRLELLRKSHSSQVPGSTPAPRDVSDPSQYQNGPSAQSLNVAPHGPPGPGASLSSITSYASQRPTDERSQTPQIQNTLPPRDNGSQQQGRDLPAPSSQPERPPAGPYGSYPSPAHPRDDVRIPGIAGGPSPAPSDRSQMNPIVHDDARSLAPPPPAPSSYHHSPKPESPLQRPSFGKHHTEEVQQPKNANSESQSPSYPSRRSASFASPQYARPDTFVKHEAPRSAPSSTLLRSREDVSQRGSPSMHPQDKQEPPRQAFHKDVKQENAPSVMLPPISPNARPPATPEQPAERQTSKPAMADDAAPRGSPEPVQTAGPTVSRPEVPPSRPVDEDYDQSAASALMSLGQEKSKRQAYEDGEPSQDHKRLKSSNDSTPPPSDGDRSQEKQAPAPSEHQEPQPTEPTEPVEQESPKNTETEEGEIPASDESPSPAA